MPQQQQRRRWRHCFAPAQRWLPPSSSSSPTSSSFPLLLLLLIMPIIAAVVGTPSAAGRLRPLILDESRCPHGWTGAGEQCVQLQFVPNRREGAEADCRQMGAQLVDVLDADGEPQAPLIEDLSDLLQTALNAGVPDQSWLVGSGHFQPEWDAASERVRFRPMPREAAADDGDTTTEAAPLGLNRRRGRHIFELVLLANSSAHPSICALVPLWRRARLYEQSALPRGAPRLEEEPAAAYSFDPASTNANDSFLSLPCSATGTPAPTIRWFRNDGEEIDLLNSSGSSASAHHSPPPSFVVSAGALLVPLSRLPPSPTTFHCLASNPLGTVRSRHTTIRPAFIQPFRDARLDAFPLISGASKGGGARLECNAPSHFPRSFSFSWVRGGSYEKFVEVSPRLFISMEGTLYFAYNVREDEDSYACTLTSAATQSAQHGPFFRLFLPLGHINPKMKQPGKGGAAQHPHAFPPRIDEFQPQLFPEVPTRGHTVYLECFAYGFPVPTYRWTRADGLPLPSGRHRLLSFGRILRISNAEVTDSGRYRCAVQNELGTASAEVRLAIQAPPTLLRPLVDRIVAPGTASASFHCHVSDSSGAVQIEWFRNGMPLVPLLLADQDRHRFQLDGNDLIITNLRQSDSGIYQCSVSNEVGSVSSSALLQVQWIPPRFHANVFPSRVFIAEGASLNLPCLFLSSPQGRGEWSRLLPTMEDGSSSDGAKEGEEREEPARHVLLDQSVPGEQIALLSLRSAQVLDSGRYRCTATSESGSASAIVQVEVISRPQVSIHSENEEEEDGSRLLTCELEINCTKADACPEALFSWEFNERPIRSLAFGRGRERIRMGQSEQQRRRSAGGTMAVVNQQSQLELPAEFVKADQVGRFACNSLFGGATAELEPPISFVPLKLSVETVDGSGTAKLHYRTIQLTSQQQGGVAAMKRRGFAVGTGKADQSRVYQLEARTARERRWKPLKRVELREGTVVAEWEPGEIELDGLEPNERYQFRLRPAGDRLQHQQAVSLSQWVQTPESVPAQPIRNLRFRMLDDRHILLEWEPIERGGHHSAPGLGYNVSWALPGGREQAELVEGPRLVISLPPENGRRRKGKEEECTILEVGVRPVNRQGPARVATQKVIRASGKAPQRVATQLRLDTVNATHLNLSWQWTGLDPCENVIGAKIVCREEEAGGGGQIDAREKEQNERPNTTRREVSQSVPADYGQWMVHGLRAEREYACRVRAFDQYGREGPTRPDGVARARTAERAPERAPEIVFVLVKEAEKAGGGGGYALLLDWKAVPIDAAAATENSSSSSSSSTATNGGGGMSPMERARQRGYKIFVYVSETADQPIVLTLTAAELHDAQRPSARIDGLKPMFFYGIQVAAFNPGGIGPRSERIPVRIGAREQPNHLVRHSAAAAENGAVSRRPMASPPLSRLLILAPAFILLLLRVFFPSTPSPFFHFLLFSSPLFCIPFGR